MGVIRFDGRDPDAPLDAAQQLRVTVRALMDERRMTQADLADRIGRTQPWLSKRINGHVRFQFDDLDRMAVAFGLTPHQLLQPGHAHLNRRSGRERRSGLDRRHRGERFSPPSESRDNGPQPRLR